MTVLWTHEYNGNHGSHKIFISIYKKDKKKILESINNEGLNYTHTPIRGVLEKLICTTMKANR